MSVLIEKPESRRSVQNDDGDLQEITLLYKLMDVSDDASARSIANSSISSTYDGLKRDRVSVEAVWVDTVNVKGEWNIEVTYVEEEDSPRKTNEMEVTIEEASETTHVSHSLETIASYAPAGETAPDQNNAINVGPDGEIGGVDIPTPVSAVTVTKFVPDASATMAYNNQLKALKQHVNNAAITLTKKRYNSSGSLVSTNVESYAAGELKFEGYTRSYRAAEDDWQYTFRFKASPNKTNIDIGDGVITVSSKKGWEYLSISWDEEKDAATGVVVRTPKAAYVHRMFESGDFTVI